MEVGVQTQAIPARNVVVINRQIAEKAKNKRIKRKVLKDIPNTRPDIKQLWRVYKTYDEPYLFRNIGQEEDIIADIENAFGDKPTDIEAILKSFKENKGISYTWNGGGGGGAGGAGGSLRALFEAGNLDDLFGSREAQAVFGGSGQAVPSSSRVVGLDPDQARREEAVFGSRIRYGLNPSNILQEADEGVARMGERNLRMTARRFADININAALASLAERTRATGASLRSGLRTGSRTASQASTIPASGLETPVRRYPQFGISEGLRTGPRLSRAPRAT